MVKILGPESQAYTCKICGCGGISDEEVQELQGLDYEELLKEGRKMLKKKGEVKVYGCRWDEGWKIEEVDDSNTRT